MKDHRDLDYRPTSDNRSRVIRLNPTHKYPNAAALVDNLEARSRRDGGILIKDLKSASEYLEDKTFQIMRLGHDSEHGMVAGL